MRPHSLAGNSDSRRRARDDGSRSSIKGPRARQHLSSSRRERSHAVLGKIDYTFFLLIHSTKRSYADVSALSWRGTYPLYESLSNGLFRHRHKKNPCLCNSRHFLVLILFLICSHPVDMVSSCHGKVGEDVIETYLSTGLRPSSLIPLDRTILAQSYRAPRAFLTSGSALSTLSCS